MADWTGHIQSQVNARGIWVRNPGTVERMPSMAGSLQDVLASIQPDDDPTEIAKPGIRTTGRANRASITQPPAPTRRVTSRPRPSPLFGEGELQTGRPRYTLRETVHMEGHRSPQWEFEQTDGRGASVAEFMELTPSVFHEDPSITLEVDTGWYQSVHAPRPAERRFHTLPSGMDIEGYEDAFPLQSQPLDMSDDIDIGGMLQEATPLPSPVPAPTTVGWSIRVLHAAEGAAWFVAGASLFGSTALAGCLLGFTAIAIL